MNSVKKIIVNILSLIPFFSSTAIGAKEGQSSINNRVLKIRNAIYNSDEERANKLVEYLFEPGRIVRDLNEPKTQNEAIENVQLFRDWDSFGKFDNFDKFNAFDNFGDFSNGAPK